MPGAHEEKKCPSCRGAIAAATWICPHCDHILDPSVLGIEHAGPRDRNASRPAWADSIIEDAMILGDVTISPDDFDVVSGAQANGDGKTSTFLFYTSGATSRMLRPDAVPQKAEGADSTKIPKTPYEDFLLSCIDGKRTVRDILKVSGLAPEEVTVTLLTLLDKRIILVPSPSSGESKKKKKTTKKKATSRKRVNSSKAKSTAKKKKKKSKKTAAKALQVELPALPLGDIEPEEDLEDTRAIFIPPVLPKPKQAEAKRENDQPPQREASKQPDKSERRPILAPSMMLDTTPKPPPLPSQRKLQSKSDAPRTEDELPPLVPSELSADDDNEVTELKEVPIPAMPPPAPSHAPSRPPDSDKTPPPWVQNPHPLVADESAKREIVAPSRGRAANSAIELPSSSTPPIRLKSAPPELPAVRARRSRTRPPPALTDPGTAGRASTSPPERSSVSAPPKRITPPRPVERSSLGPAVERSSANASPRPSVDAIERSAIGRAPPRPSIEPNDRSGVGKAPRPPPIAPSRRRSVPDPAGTRAPRRISRPDSDAPRAISAAPTSSLPPITGRPARPRTGPGIADASTLLADHTPPPKIQLEREPPRNDTPAVQSRASRDRSVGGVRTPTPPPSPPASARSDTPLVDDPRDATPPPKRAPNPKRQPRLRADSEQEPPLDMTAAPLPKRQPRLRADSEQEPPLDKTAAPRPRRTPPAVMNRRPPPALDAVPDLDFPDETGDLELPDDTPPPSVAPVRLPSGALQPVLQEDSADGVEDAVAAALAELNAELTPKPQDRPPLGLFDDGEDGSLEVQDPLDALADALGHQSLGDHLGLGSSPPPSRGMPAPRIDNEGPRIGAPKAALPRLDSEFIQVLDPLMPKAPAEPPPDAERKRSAALRRPIRGAVQERDRRRGNDVGAVDAAPPAPVAKRSPRPTTDDAGVPIDGVRMAKADKLFDEALRDKAEGNLVSARMNMKLALTFDPNNPLYLEAFEELAKAAPTGSHVTNKARQFFEQATQAERAGELDKAIGLYERALIEGKEPAFYNRLGVVLAMKKFEFGRAQKLIETAVALAPKNATYQHNLKKVLTLAATHDVEQRELANAGRKKGLLGFLGRKK